MALKLDKQTTVVVDTIRVASVQVALDPFRIDVGYERGATSGSDFKPVDSGTAKFEQADLAAVEGGGQLASQLNATVYALLQAKFGSGKVV